MDKTHDPLTFFGGKCAWCHWRRSTGPDIRPHLRLPKHMLIESLLVKDSRPPAILEEDYDPALDNKIAIEFVESQGRSWNCTSFPIR